MLVVGEVVKFVVFHVVVYPDRDVVSGVIDGIFNKIPEYGVDERFISFNNSLRIYLVFHVNPVCYDRVMQIINGFLAKRVVDVYLFFVEKFGCLFCLGDEGNLPD